MPERQRVTWAQLRVGTLVIVSLTILAIGIFFISGQVGFFTHRYTLKAYLSTAGGVREGAEVRLAGIAVGNVARIRISPYPEPQRAVELDMRISRNYQNQIRADSVATMETVGLLGEGYIDISRGSSGQAVIPDGGEVRTSEEPDIKMVVRNANDVISNLRVLSAKLNDITGEIQTGKGSIGQLIYTPTFANRLNATLDGVERLVNRVEGGQGTIGKLVSDETLYQRTLATVDRLNQVIDDMEHGKGSIAKFISDPSVYDNVNRLVTHADTLVTNVNNGQGTLGKLATDPQLYNRMNDSMDRVDALTTRMEHGEGTLGKLSTDPTLYNNLSESSKTLKDFLSEFKKNPKKYLTLRLRIF
jgi:phospholipid/cholesterol/gamma-HCH transport system substrate-binding protein